ncbi:hypothetical protein QGM71_05035 [Virgibacillus sp. C22-A2]|uniref:Flagellar operon protein n=1 Tax=Virgibacillus tibetensis TaxID=3042313 RepID=A0ABU6KC06_9BACI|nr:hypothetical protein [Virgibacillus sp. C22-A2]
MAELANCARCDTVFVKGLREICQSCYKEEEKAFDLVYRFLHEQKNREATMIEVAEGTGVSEKLISKFIKDKRLLTSQFPKLAYPCERCDKNIVTGMLCSSCAQELKNEMELHEKNEERVDEIKKKNEKESRIYYTFD